MQIIISGIAVEVCKKNIKNMHLYVKPPGGKVSVSAPIDMSDEAIERFVRTKSSWIKQQVKNFEVQPRQTEREYVSGETLYVWGKQYFLQVEYGTGKNSLVLSGDKAILTVRKDSTKEQRDSFVKEWYRDLLKRELARLLPKWENITGLKCNGWQTKYMTTRWGTCNTDKRKLWFNLQLAKKTPDCLEYIILHELLHLVERNHNAHFLSLMDKYMPYWRETKRKLNGQILDFMG
ncbi:SprT family zinc-dependent metalloprotease [Paenibacillus ehimensis]|uniref:M48 family metallopeptidase n=1 Tax=Paenibacillus ehimensis TaxID=79264 RepID=UPI002DB97079|nr:SprT family zinc-dependent metalloprotease [Paenibacillus ehimensis]MEC0209857.1 SprT family zinc-dependent metalloprotease [Paenibacillus ehimensis]